MFDKNYNNKPIHYTKEMLLKIAREYEEKGPKGLGIEMDISYLRIAAIASRLRKAGVNIPKRTKIKGVFNEAVLELKRDQSEHIDDVVKRNEMYTNENRKI